MPKDISGNVPLSKSALRKKISKKTEHGGICSSCGQTSTSCTTDSKHESCSGVYLGNFENKFLTDGQSLFNVSGESVVLADGSLATSFTNGNWISASEFASRRDINATLMATRVGQVIKLTSVFDDKKYIRTDAVDFYGRECYYSRLEKQWVPVPDVIQS